MYLCEMTGVNWYVHKYMVLQYPKLFHSDVSTGFLQQDFQGSYSFGKTQNLRDLEISEEKM